MQVVLPEGASSISAKVPFPVNQTQEVKQTYLDTTGRPVVVLHKTNAVPDHDVPFTVTYSFFSVLMLKEPLLLVSAFAVLFAAIIAYSHSDFVLSRDDKWQADRQQEKSVALVQKFASIIAGEQLIACYSWSSSEIYGHVMSATSTQTLCKPTAASLKQSL